MRNEVIYQEKTGKLGHGNSLNHEGSVENERALHGLEGPGRGRM